MPETRAWIEKHLFKAQKEYDEGKYENANAELEIVLGRINEEIERLKPVGSKEKLPELATRYRVLSELNDYSRRVRARLEIVRKEKERSKSFQSIVKGMHKRRIIDAIRRNQKAVEEFRDRDRTIENDKRFVKILRRWNSYTPLLCLDVVENVGGGYFLSLDGVGIVVDPGINFVRNAVSSRLSMKDIDVIILTHSHVDHTSDFEGLVTLFHEINAPRYNMGLDPIQFSLYTSIGAMNKYCNLVSFSYDMIKEVTVMNPDSTYHLSDSISMKTTQCKHRDLFCSHSASCVGLKFYDAKQSKPIVAITSDTGYDSQLKSDFADLRGNPVILHIGGIMDEEIELAPPPSVPIYRDHLGLRGVLNFIFDVKPSAAIISEFGEEFRETRTSISELLQQEFVGKTKVIPADVGLTVKFADRKPYAIVACDNCHSEMPIAEIHTTQNRKGQSLVYLCPNCMHKRKRVAN